PSWLHMRSEAGIDGQRQLEILGRHCRHMRRERRRSQRIEAKFRRCATGGEPFADEGQDARAEQLQHKLALLLADDTEASKGRAFMDDTVAQAIAPVELRQQRRKPRSVAAGPERTDPQAMTTAA